MLRSASRWRLTTARSSGWADQGWTSVNLRHADAAELREVVAEAWAEAAPKRLVAAFAGRR